MKKLQICLHDVSPVLGDRSRRMADIILKKAGPAFTMLVVPDYHCQGQLDNYPEFCSWLREMQAIGVQVAQHGCTHLDPSSKSTLSGRLLTGGEGEFLTMNPDDAEKNITRGFNILSGALGRKPQGFTAPAWLYSRGTREALKGFSYKWIEYRSFVDIRENGRERSPVIVFASRTPWKRLCSVLWSVTAPVVFGMFPDLRIAFHVKDLPLLEKQVTYTLEKTVPGRVCSLCGDMGHTP